MKVSKKNTSELEFEHEVIEYLTKIGGSKQWEYAENIKDTEGLWQNFKTILEQNNQSRLKESLSEAEFAQVRKVINNLETPYQAGQFLYGMNGVSEIEVDMDNGDHIYLTVFDQSQVGAGNTVYQIVNQISRPKVVDGKQPRRFDVTLLINGLPIIQIELKKAMHAAKEALNQMEQYIAEKQYSGIYSTLQVLIAMTPYEIRYMANSTREMFNRAFAFNWQNEEDAKPVRDWKTFADKVLSIPMAHELGTRYMILDGTRSRQSIKVMRPYQVYATKRVLEKARQHDFKSGDGNLGYIWHTTGSGKTITSFKTAWLTSHLPNVNKVIFLVDRVALTNQTVDSYRAYDPIAGFAGKTGVIADTAKTSDLHRQLTTASDKNIIVTSIQKMHRYVTSESFKNVEQNILFIVDEAHRSTGDGESDGMLERIRRALPTAAWVGYTGTPRFPVTRRIFGDLLHAYTIKEAIADRNVLGFNVEFKNTIPAPENASEQEIDDMIMGSVYDTSSQHVELVAKDIFENWKSRSNNGMYNALMTVHVGGREISSPRVMEYFDTFNKLNEQLPEDERLKIAVSFSMSTSNNDNQTEINENLHRAIQHYNKMFGTSWDMTTTKEYTEDVARRLNRSTEDGKYLDLVIVVDQFLTGFDAPKLNTLYIDRTLKGANLIQAYSRTNRMQNIVDKPYGNVVNYRWPVQNEMEMNKAFYEYSNRESANEDIELDLGNLKKENQDSGILAKPFSEVEEEMQGIVERLGKLTDNYIKLPDSEREQGEVYEELQQYNRTLNTLKQYTEDDEGNPVSAYEDPDSFYERIGITSDQEIVLTTVLAGELKERMAKREGVDVSQIDLEMVHIHEVTINYDYLIELIAQMADQVHDNQMEEAHGTYQEIQAELAKSDNEDEKTKVKSFVGQILSGEYKFASYPAPRNVEQMNQAMSQARTDTSMRKIVAFVRHWGLDNTISPKDLAKLIQKHRIGKDDLDNKGELTQIMTDARTDYPEIAASEVQELTWIRYRRSVREALYKLADDIKKFD